MTLETGEIVDNWDNVTADYLPANSRPLAGLTREDIAELRRPFDLREHSTNYDGWPYIEKGPLMKRLKSIDPSAALTMSAPDWMIADVVYTSKQGDGVTQFAQVSIAATITIKGVAHMDYGSADIKRRGKQWNEPTKEAATDAIKRAAMQAGLGAYLLWFPKGQNWDQGAAKFLEQYAAAWAAMYDDN